MHTQQDFYYTFHDAIKLLDGEIPYNRVENLKFNQKYPIYFPAGYLTIALLSSITGLREFKEFIKVWKKIARLSIFVLALGLLILSLETLTRSQEILAFSCVCALLSANQLTLYAASNHFDILTFGFLVWGIIMKLKHNYAFVAGCLFGLSLSYKQTMLLGYPFLFIFLCYTNDELVRLTKGFIFSIFLILLPFLIFSPIQFIKATIIFHITRLDATDFFSFFIPTIDLVLGDATKAVSLGLFLTFYLRILYKVITNKNLNQALFGFFFSNMWIFLSNKVLFPQYYVPIFFNVILFLMLKEILSKYLNGKLNN